MGGQGRQVRPDHEMMKELHIKTGKRTEMVNITALVEGALREHGVKDGLCCVYVPHTTAAVTINENADPSVPEDILMELNKRIPFEDNYSHSEGNSAAHIKSSLVGCEKIIPIEGGSLVLGTW